MCLGAAVAKVKSSGMSVTDRMRKIATLESATMNVGYLENETYDDGMPVAQAAFFAEYGTSTAPARPTFRPLIERERKAWFDEMIKRLMSGNKPITVLKLMGNKISDQLKLAIRDTPVSPLSNVTLMLRKMRDEGATITGASLPIAIARLNSGEAGASGTRAKPLMDTGVMQTAPNYEIVSS